MEINMASKIIKFCFAARQVGLNKISTCQPVIQCAKCLNTRLLIYPVNLSSRNFSSTINRYTEQSLAKNENKDLQKPEEMDVLYKSILLEYKSHDTGVIRSYQKFTEMAAKELDIEISQIYTPKRDITRFAVLKSVHIYKKHKVQYETRTHYKLIELKHLTGSTADTFLEYLERNLPEGVAMKITKTRLERMPDHLLQEQKQRLSKLSEDHMVLEDVSGTLQDDNENLTQSSLNVAKLESENDNTIKATTESAMVDDKKESIASESVKDNSDSDSDSSSNSSDSDSDSDSESIDKKGETKDSPTDKNS